jgi:hypothetical protein
VQLTPDNQLVGIGRLVTPFLVPLLSMRVDLRR